jgi:hypothetical protein
MKKTLFFLSLLMAPLLVYALDSSFGTDYSFIHHGNYVNVEGYFSAASKAKIDKKGFHGSHLRYGEQGSAIFINAYPAKHHAFSIQLGYGLTDLNWKQNPAFKQKTFSDGIFSLGYISTAIEHWRWVINLGAHANLDHFSWSRNTFYRGMLWGRLTCRKTVGAHLGVLGQSGVKSSYLFPILVFDWAFHEKWKINAIFPLDFSLHYFFAKNWSSALSYRSFGGWYHSFHRVGKNEREPESMVSVHSNGVDLGIDLNTKHFSAELFVGANLGGWMLIRNRHGGHSRYFHFDSAAYGGIRASLKF